MVDVLIPNYPPASSKFTKTAAGDTLMDDIVLGQPGAASMAGPVDMAGKPVSDAEIMVLAETARVLPAPNRSKAGLILHSSCSKLM